jgi:outer membrane protein TolC
MKNIFIFLCFVLPFGKKMIAQTILDSYIKESLKSSLTLKQEGFLLEKAMFGLEEAKRLRQPNINFSTTYTLGAGGRSIDFPIGDLLNGVYASLNQLTNTKNFPQLENQKVVLNPYNFYDAKFRTTYPLVNAEIKINEKVKAQAIPLKQAEINVYKRELVKEVKTAYFRYLQATQGISIYENGLKLLNELKRVNQSLVTNGVSNTSILVRSNAEIAKLDAQLSEAKNNQKNAAAYFNFLINKDLNAVIEVDSQYLSHVAVFPTDIKADTKNREELQKLQAAATLAGLGLDYQKAFFKPKLGTFVDLGSQGFLDKRGQTPYVFGGISFEYPIYDGKRDKQRIKQAEADINALQAQTENIENQLDLQLNVAVNNYYSALTIYQNSQGQIQLTQRYYSDLFKRYKEGQALLIELLEANTQQLNAELQRSIALSNVWIKLTDVERISAGYEFK